MKAIRVVRPGHVEVMDVDVPKPTSGQVLVKVEASSICSMHELKVYKGTYKQGMWSGYPSRIGSPGHEGAGVIVEVGEGVTDFAPGDRVVMTGYGGGGLHAQYVTRDPQWIEKFGEALPFDEAAPAELVACLVNAFEHAGLLLGKVVAISGLGAAGLLAVQLARVCGAMHVVGIDVREERLQLGKEVGADDVYDPRTADFAFLKGNKVDVVIDCSGNAISIQNSFSIAREQVILFGYTDQDFSVDQSVWFQSELTIRNAKIMGKNPKQSFRTAVRLLQSGRVTTKPIISKTMPMSSYVEALDILDQKKAIKVVLHPWDD